MNNAEYWRKRGEILKIASEKQAADYCDFALDEFEKASARIQKEIDAWYMRFAKNNEISFAEAKKWLTSGELKELHWDVQEYIKAGESLNPKWYKALENASSRVHISRLEALKLQIQQQIEALYGGQAKDLDQLMSQIYQDSYYRSIFEIQKGFQLGWEIPRLDVEKLSTVLKKPWTTDGRTFSDRIWGNKDQLVNTLHTSLTQGIIRGESPQKIAAQLVKTMNVAKSNASRLIRTETAYFHEQAQKQVYEDLDVEEYEILETLDTRTCAVCGGLDGKVFKKSEHEPGVTAPPFHPNCRGTTVPYFADDEGERIARDINGKTYYVPSNMTYEEWKAQQDTKYGEGTVNKERQKRYNRDADKEQYKRYKDVLQELSPKSLDDFLEIKYNKEKDWNQLKFQYRTLNRYEVDGKVSAKKILELDNAAYYTKQTGFDYSNLTGKIRRKIEQLPAQGNAAVMEFEESIYFAHSRVAKPGTVEYDSYSGKYPIIGLNDVRIFSVKNLGDGIPRENDTEAKFLEYVATKKKESDKFNVTILSEKHICDSCQGVVDQFKKLFPNATVNIVSGKKGYGGSEKGTITWKRRKKVR